MTTSEPDPRTDLAGWLGLKPWSFISDGSLDYAEEEDHNYAVLIGDNDWWCAGCLSRSPRHFTPDDPSRHQRRRTR